MARTEPVPETSVREQSRRGRFQDRAKDAGGQHESCEAKKTGASPAEIRTAVKQIGNSRTKVEGRLGECKGPKRVGASVA